ncbi:MAG: bis(5'-nucleosyl)-tetraphosphatase (symmetrical) YqeK [Vulcanimicrobiaceae bacterium]
MTGLEFVRLSKHVRHDIGQRHRFAHTLGVARLARRLARRHGADAQRALLAGMLHDLARLYAPERLLSECEARNMRIDAFERAHPTVLHARLGAELAREQFGVTDDAVLAAIRKHTLGSATMSTLDTIVYLADGLEPGRRFEERAALERLALRNLDAAMRATLRSTVDYNKAHGRQIAPATAAAIEFFATKEKQTA